MNDIEFLGERNTKVLAITSQPSDLKIAAAIRSLREREKEREGGGRLNRSYGRLNFRFFRKLMSNTLQKLGFNVKRSDSKN